MDFIITVLGPDQDRHIDFLTIHPRTRSTPSSTPINVEALEILTSTFGSKVPILVSGDVFTLNSLPFASPLLPPSQQQEATFTTTATATIDDEANPHQNQPRINLPHLAGLMSARAILANPALYAGYDACPWSAVETFLNHVVRCPLPLKLVLHHVSEMCAPGMGPNKSALLSKRERSVLMSCSNMVDLIDFLDEKRAAAAVDGEIVGHREGNGGEGGGKEEIRGMFRRVDDDPVAGKAQWKSR
jgi:tRNA-dihydrouridine synthase 4